MSEVGEVSIKKEYQPIEFQHKVLPSIKEACGIEPNEPVVLMVHITRADIAEDEILRDGFINVSERGTLAPITDNPDSYQEPGVPSIALKKTQTQSSISMITFCLPASQVMKDPEGKYGYWFNNPLPDNANPKLKETYDQTVVKYNPFDGTPLKKAKDDPSLYPVYIPPKYIIGIATSA